MNSLSLVSHWSLLAKSAVQFYGKSLSSITRKQTVRTKNSATRFHCPSATCVSCEKILPPDGEISFSDSLYIRGTRCPPVRERVWPPSFITPATVSHH